MLKSELVVSQDIKLLDSQLNSYCISVLNPNLPDGNKASGDNYVDAFKRLNNALKGDLGQFRNRFISHLTKEINILAVINMILTKDDYKELNIDTGLLDDAKQQIAIVNKNIDDCCKNPVLNQSMVIQYYFNSLQLLSYFTAIRASITTIQNICKKFNQDENSCVLKFIHTKKTSFAISQQKTILEFVEKVFKDLFGDHLDIVKVDVDTGSPEFEIIIKILVELDLNSLFSELFELIFNSQVAKAVRTVLVIYAMLIKSRKSGTKKPSKENIEDRINEINGEYNEPSGNFIVGPKRINANKIEIQVSSPEKEVKIEEQAVSTHNECEIERIKRMKEQKAQDDAHLTKLKEV